MTSLLTSGDVAESRHTAGMKFEAVTPSAPSSITRPVVNLTEEELKALFNVLWTFERINGLFASLQRPWFGFRSSKAQKLLLDVSAGAITMWSSYAQFDVRDPPGNKLIWCRARMGLLAWHKNCIHIISRSSSKITDGQRRVCQRGQPERLQRARSQSAMSSSFWT